MEHVPKWDVFDLGTPIESEGDLVYILIW